MRYEDIYAEDDIKNMAAINVQRQVICHIKKATKKAKKYKIIKQLSTKSYAPMFPKLNKGKNNWINSRKQKKKMPSMYFQTQRVSIQNVLRGTHH